MQIYLKNDRELKTRSTDTVNSYKIKIFLKNKIKLQSTNKYCKLPDVELRTQRSRSRTQKKSEAKSKD